MKDVVSGSTNKILVAAGQYLQVYDPSAQTFTNWFAVTSGFKFRMEPECYLSSDPHNTVIQYEVQIMNHKPYHSIFTTKRNVQVLHKIDPWINVAPCGTP